jgi:hypothetical protein
MSSADAAGTAGHESHRRVVPERDRVPAPRPGAPRAHASNTGTGDPPWGRGPGVALSSGLVRVVALRTALREAVGSGLVNLIVMLVSATDAPHEGSGSAPFRGRAPRAACRGQVDLFFLERGRDLARALRLCSTCPYARTALRPAQTNITGSGPASARVAGAGPHDAAPPNPRRAGEPARFPSSSLPPAPATARRPLSRSHRDRVEPVLRYRVAHTSSVASCAASTESHRPTVVICERPGGSSRRT